MTAPFAYAVLEASGQAVVGHLDASCRDNRGGPAVSGHDPWPCSRCVSLEQLEDWERRTPAATARGWASSAGTAAAERIRKTSAETIPSGGVACYTEGTTTDRTKDTTMSTTTRSNDLTAEILEGLKNAFATAARYGVPGVEDMRQATLKCYRLGDLTAQLALDLTDTYVAAAQVKAQVAADQASTPAPKPTGPAFEKGMIITNAAGQIVRVYQSKTGNFYGKVRDEYGTWEYQKGAMAGARHLTADEARSYGLTNERCVFCATPIETKESLAVGYGPDCADKYGLPWGTK